MSSRLTVAQRAESETSTSLWLRLNAALRRYEAATTWLALGLSFGLTLLVYWPVLGYSYFLDDAFDLTRTEEESFWSLLIRPLPHYVYYRPVPFILWKAIYELTGSYDPFLLHAIPVVAHALSGWLLFLLLRRVTGSLWSLLPAALFLLYPFSYQAVAILGTLVHTLVTVQILAALLLWYDGRMQNSPIRLALAGVIAVLALWTHEYGAAIFPLMAAIEGLLWLQDRIRRPTLWLLLPLVAELVYLRLWFTIDKPEHDHITNADIVHNAGFWLQGFAYPFSRQTYWLTDLFGGNPLRLVLFFSLAGILLACAAYALGRRYWLPLVALSFGGVVFLPAVATLTYEYMQNGPRLLYIVAPACAAFWGLLPLIRFPNRRATIIWRATTLVLALVIAVQSVLFIQRRLVMFDHGTQVANGVIALGEKYPDGSLLFINVPSWFAPKNQEFPRGHLGVQVEPDYIGLERLIYAGSGEQVQVESRSLAPDVSGWLYHFQPHGGPIDHNEIDARLREGAVLALADLYQDSLAVREPGSLQPGQPAPANRIASFGDALWLLDAELSRDGDLHTMTSRWYADRQLEADYQLWVQLRTAAGVVIAERKDYALRGMSPPRLWQPGDLIEDRLVLDLSGTRRTDDLEVWVALVNTADGSLLPAVSEARPVADGWVKIVRQ